VVFNFGIVLGIKWHRYRPHTFAVQLLIFNCSGIVGATCARLGQILSLRPVSDLPLRRCRAGSSSSPRQLSWAIFSCNIFSCRSAFAFALASFSFPFRVPPPISSEPVSREVYSFLARPELYNACGSTSLINRSISFVPSRCGHFAAAEKMVAFTLSLHPESAAHDLLGLVIVVVHINAELDLFYGDRFLCFLASRLSFPAGKILP